ncbi:hypothetical protein ACH49_13590 [Streptomyces leeuwenhoekii]|uniref:Integral Membrane Protein n=1 Tax=Streptomyces leeuwenhoekii TaxID=1437453 RepID=A0ABR5HZ41_STRLW|nr:hypothetical protein [Streptomyces leeuwenhoekii]KMS79084.1 hypothetical protein ACH49_13590 [Streptomyces leeuwenhoekii]
MIAEAIDTALTLGWAFLIWLTLVSLTAALALHTLIAIAWWTARTTWRAVRGTSAPGWARSRYAARLIARRTRPDYEEAA